MKHIRFLSLAVAAVALMAPLSAQAMENTTRAGWYIGGGGMGVMQRDAESKIDEVTDIIKYDIGWGVSGSGGYAWGSGIRTEAEVAYRRSKVDEVTGTGSGPDNGGHIRNISFMGNLLYDFNTGTRYTPYIGAGIGTSVVGADDMKTVNFRTLDSDRVEFAYQAIAGVSALLDHNWSTSLDYRYFATTHANFKTNLADHRAKTENASHNVMLGLRYMFDEVAPPPSPPAPRVAQAMPPAPPAAASAARPAVPPVPQSYMVFFDFDKSVLTPEAQRIIAAAAQDFKSGKYVRLVVTGHTDTMGTNKYNQKLSERRAAAVRSEFVRLGVPAGEVATRGVGESSLLVPTSDQVREAQNRRAEIVFNK